MYERVGTWPLAWRQHVFDKAFGLDPQRRDPGAEPGRVVELLLPAGLDENGSASFAEDASAYLHADAKRRRLMTAVTDRRAPKCFLWSCG
jgi:hypothetical protein